MSNRIKPEWKYNTQGKNMGVYFTYKPAGSGFSYVGQLTFNERLSIEYGRDLWNCAFFPIPCEVPSDSFQKATASFIEGKAWLEDILNELAPA